MKLLSTVAAAAAALSAVAARPAARDSAPVVWGQGRSPPYPMPDFTLRDQNGQPFSRQQLLGHVWVANFVALQRGPTSSLLTERLSALASRCTNADVRFVSFSVDPSDAPAVLDKFRRMLGAADWRWRFLAADQISFPEIADSVGLNTSPFDVPSRIMLIDPDGIVRASFDAFDDREIAQLSAFLQALNVH